MENIEKYPLHFNPKAKTFKIIATVEILRQTLAHCELCAAFKFLPNLNVGT